MVESCGASMCLLPRRSTPIEDNRLLRYESYITSGRSPKA
jgi:hypothetical protein